MTNELPKYLTYSKVGKHRGSPRLWFNTACLADIGFTPGQRFDTHVDGKSRTIEISLSGSGKHQVSRKVRHGQEVPVIDLNNVTLAEALAGVGRVRAIFQHERIVVTVHPDDLAQQDRVDRLLWKLANGESLDIGSICHGAGILDRSVHDGLSEAGVDSRLSFAIEIDSNALEASLKNSGLWDERSMAILAPMQEVESYLLPKVDLLIAGLPCVGASKSGKAKNGINMQEEHPDAGALFVSWLSVIKHVNPSIAMLENVNDWKTSASQAITRQVLNTWGYEIHETAIDGHDMGSLERRKRFAMVAVPRGLTFNWADILPVRQRPDRLGDVLEVLPDNDPRWKDYSYLDSKAERDREAGKNFKTQVRTPDDTSVGTIGAGYNKVRSTEPRIKHPTNETLTRLLTPVEHARVKGVDPRIVDGVDKSIAHRLLGNSVTGPSFVAAGHLIGRAVRDFAAENRAAIPAQRPQTLDKAPAPPAAAVMPAAPSKVPSPGASMISRPPPRRKVPPAVQEDNGPDQLDLPGFAP